MELTERVRDFLRTGCLPELANADAVNEQTIQAAYGKAPYRHEMGILIYERAEFHLHDEGRVLFVAYFYRPVSKFRALGMQPLNQRIGIYTLLDALDHADIKWSVSHRWSFDMQLAIRTQGGVTILFSLLYETLEKLTCWLKPYEAAMEPF